MNMKQNITSMVFTGLFGVMSGLDTQRDIIIVCGILGLVFIVYMLIQGTLDFIDRQNLTKPKEQ